MLALQNQIAPQNQAFKIEKSRDVLSCGVVDGQMYTAGQRGGESSSALPSLMEKIGTEEGRRDRRGKEAMPLLRKRFSASFLPFLQEQQNRTRLPRFLVIALRMVMNDETKGTCDDVCCI